jgi:antitoxin component of MazEF toxin-antitoxin module
MASEATLHTHYIGKVLPNGHLEIPPTVVESMGLKDGDEVVVALHKVTAAGVSVPAEAQTLIQELVGTPSSLQETVEA